MDLSLSNMIQDDSSRLKIINKCTADAWADEDEDIKAIVKKEREAEVEGKERKKKRNLTCLRSMPGQLKP